MEYIFERDILGWINLRLTRKANVYTYKSVIENVLLFQTFLFIPKTIVFSQLRNARDYLKCKKD